MKLYLLRHGLADWPDWKRPDDERPLTAEGRKTTRRMAKHLHQLQAQPAVVLSSPLPRAWETAEITAELLELELREENALGPGFNAAKFRRIIEENRGKDLMLVGHEPDFSAVVRALTGGDVKLAKGGITRIDLAPNRKTGRLIWLIPPKAAKGRRA
ncbi:MAG TPA: phosphohistidine phosphatase SixA [Chthoniobacterales bacterium]|nr:phosphohistidine phosphatase SixA [Chthoniobacterales bacterium]